MITGITRALVKMYPEILPMLQGAAKAMALSTDAPDNAQRVKLEKKFSRAMRDHFKRQFDKLITVQKATQLHFDFWESEKRELFEIIYEFILAGAEGGAQTAFDDMPPQLGISWDIVNTDAKEWAKKYTAEVVAQISKTSMDAFTANFGEWVESGEPLEDLIKRLEPYYGEPRAEMVAVTETTRAYAEGNIAVWRNSGVVHKFNWFTVMEGLTVCDECAAKQAENPHNIDDEKPPLHPRCRCYLQPVTEFE